MMRLHKEITDTAVNLQFTAPTSH